MSELLILASVGILRSQASQYETYRVIASWRENHLSDLIQSPALRAPEVTIGAPWDTGVDIWSLGCLVRVVYYFVHHTNYSDI
jgi:serine/threonine protein kinase